MGKRLRIPLREVGGEIVREVVASILAVIMIVPLAIIRLVDRFISWRIGRRGGLD